MGRKRKNAVSETNNDSFNDVFGSFNATGASDTQYRPTILTKVTNGLAHHCNVCGKYPRIHDVCFKDKDKHVKHYYIDCECCSNCDGEWYETAEDAIAAWNKLNPLETVEVDRKAEKMKEFVEDIMKYSRVSA